MFVLLKHGVYDDFNLVTALDLRLGRCVYALTCSAATEKRLGAPRRVLILTVLNHGGNTLSTTGELVETRFCAQADYSSNVTGFPSERAAVNRNRTGRSRVWYM